MKTLILYTTKHGTAAQAASLLKVELGSDVAMIDLGRDKAPDLNAYDAVILGGSIYVGSIQKKMGEFIQGNAKALQGKRLGLFLCAGMENDWHTAMDKAFPQELRSHAAACDNLGYAFDFKKMNFIEKTAIGKIAGIKESVNRLSREKIKAFAQAMMG